MLNLTLLLLNFRFTICCVYVATESTVIIPLIKIQTTPPWEFHPRQHTGSPHKAVTNNGRHRLPYKILYFRKTIKIKCSACPQAGAHTHPQTTHRAAVLLRDRLGQRSILIRAHAQPRAHRKAPQSVRNTTTAKEASHMPSPCEADGKWSPNMPQQINNPARRNGSIPEGSHIPGLPVCDAICA